MVEFSLKKLMLLFLTILLSSCSPKVPIARILDKLPVNISKNYCNEKLSITVSSYNLPSQSPLKVCDNNLNTYWHIKERGMGWLEIDLGKPLSINLIQIFPRKKYHKQVFKNAIIEGGKYNKLSSNKSRDWTRLAHLNWDSIPSTDDAKIWALDNNRKYRFYTISFFTGHTGSGQFNSLAELKLFYSANIGSSKL